MILHFLRRDFLTYRLYWILVLLTFPLVLTLEYAYQSTEWMLIGMYFYFFFAMVPQRNLTGVAWRSQHVMSRNYLLALPIVRTRLFAIAVLRSMVFFAPMLWLLWIGTALVPLGETDRALFRPLPIFIPMSVLAAGWMFCSSVSMQIRFERVAAQSKALVRAGLSLRALIEFIVEGAVLAVLVPSYTLPYGLRYLYWLRLAIVTVVVANRWRLAQRLWLGK